MTTTKVTGKMAKSLVDRAIAEQGADHYGSVSGTKGGGCFYQYGGRPVCIVGYAISYLTDVPLETLFPDPYNSTSWSGGVPQERAAMAGLVFTKKANEFLMDAQNAQDSGLTWGEARERATSNANARAAKAKA